jgi:hypothetical protein
VCLNSPHALLQERLPCKYGAWVLCKTNFHYCLKHKNEVRGMCDGRMGNDKVGHLELTQEKELPLM